MLALALPARALEPTLVSIGTGGKTGVYYLAGGAICGLVDERRWETGLRCVAEASDGSIQNLRDVRSGARTFAIVQSDWQFHAANGSGAFRQAGPDRELRSVASLFREPFTVVARPDAGIRAFADLKGKRVSLGPAGSGGRATMGELMQELGWSEDAFGWVADLAMPDVPRALCEGEIDAAVFVVAHPNLAVEDMLTSCDAVLVPVGGPEIDQVIGASPYYTSTEIAAGTYAGLAAGVPTFALTATLVASARTSPAVVYELTRALFENLDVFRAAHPAFADLDKIADVLRGADGAAARGGAAVFRAGEAQVKKNRRRLSISGRVRSSHGHEVREGPRQREGDRSMRVMVFVKATEDSEAGRLPDDRAMFEAMGKFNEELVAAGIMLAGDGLKPSREGKRVAFDGPGRTVIDGPFAETRELVAGYWLWEVKDMDEAVAWVKRCPNPMFGPSEIEIRPLYEMADFADA